MTGGAAMGIVGLSLIGLAVFVWWFRTERQHVEEDRPAAPIIYVNFTDRGRCGQRSRVTSAPRVGAAGPSHDEPPRAA